MPLQDFRFARLAVTAILPAANAPKRRCLTTLTLHVESADYLVPIFLASLKMWYFWG